VLTRGGGLGEEGKKKKKELPGEGGGQWQIRGASWGERGEKNCKESEPAISILEIGGTDLLLGERNLVQKHGAIQNTIRAGEKGKRKRGNFSTTICASDLHQGIRVGEKCT